MKKRKFILKIKNNQEGGGATYMHVAGGFSVSMCVNAIHYDAIVFWKYMFIWHF